MNESNKNIIKIKKGVYRIKYEGLVECSQCEKLIIKGDRIFIDAVGSLLDNEGNITMEDIGIYHYNCIIQQIEDDIEQGENETIEFKAYLKWNKSKKKEMKDKLKFRVAKSISGFMNTNGGKIYIGVKDNGDIIGIGKDLNALGKKNKDGFRLELIGVMKKYMGNAYPKLWKANFHTVKNKEVCLINVYKSSEPIYIKKENEELFYIRKESSTELLSLSEAIKYINAHFRNSYQK